MISLLKYKEIAGFSTATPLDFRLEDAILKYVIRGFYIIGTFRVLVVFPRIWPPATDMHHNYQARYPTDDWHLAMCFHQYIFPWLYVWEDCTIILLALVARTLPASASGSHKLDGSGVVSGSQQRQTRKRRWTDAGLSVVYSDRKYQPFRLYQFYIPSNLLYKTHLSRRQNCWPLRCSWSIACRRCSNYIFIIGLTRDFNRLHRDNCKMWCGLYQRFYGISRESFVSIATVQPCDVCK